MTFTLVTFLSGSLFTDSTAASIESGQVTGNLRRRQLTGTGYRRFGKFNTKCKTASGGDPKHKFYSGKSEIQCKQECNMRCDCSGFSHSEYNNCLLWLEKLHTTDTQYGAGWEGCWIRPTKTVEIEQTCPPGWRMPRDDCECKKAASSTGKFIGTGSPPGTQEHEKKCYLSPKKGSRGTNIIIWNKRKTTANRPLLCIRASRWYSLWKGPGKWESMQFWGEALNAPLTLRNPKVIVRKGHESRGAQKCECGPTRWYGNGMCSPTYLSRPTGEWLSGKKSSSKSQYL